MFMIPLLVPVRKLQNEENMMIKSIFLTAGVLIMRDNFVLHVVKEIF